MSLSTPSSAVDRLLAGIESGTISGDLFGDDGVFDATVPNWRFTEHDIEHTCHQAHILKLDNGRVAIDTAFTAGAGQPHW